VSVGAWLELLASGLITGGIYALVALGLNLQYGLMRILNIAHGEFLMVGAYLTWLVQTTTGVSPLAMLPVSFLVLGALGVAVHRLCFRTPGRDLAQPRHLRGARPDGAVRPDVPGAELRLLDVGRRPARLRLPGRAGEDRQAQFAGNKLLVFALALVFSGALILLLAHDAAGQGRARADAVAGRRAAGGHRHQAPASADVRIGLGCRAWPARCCPMAYTISPSMGEPYTVTALIVITLAASAA
jgi:branched-chain amino acid transport system permease protein